MAEWAEICREVTDLKKDLILNLDIVAWWTVNKKKQQ
jgi:hypothetical protein